MNLKGSINHWVQFISWVDYHGPGLRADDMIKPQTLRGGNEDGYRTYSSLESISGPVI